MLGLRGAPHLTGESKPAVLSAFDMSHTRLGDTSFVVYLENSLNLCTGPLWQKKGPPKNCASPQFETHLYINQLTKSSSDEEQSSNKARRVACLQVRLNLFIEY